MHGFFLICSNMNADLTHEGSGYYWKTLSMYPQKAEMAFR